MALFSYRAIDKQGQRKKGTIEAPSEKDARIRLRDQGLMPLQLSLSTKSSKNALKGSALQAFTLQLSQLVGAGIPLYESLVALEEQARGEPYHPILISICDQIKGGKALSEALAEYPASFDRLYCGLVAAGESVGDLGTVLERLSLLLSKQMKLKRQITTALIYPSILAVFALSVIILLLGFVVPSIEGIFEGRKLNGFTAFVLEVSRFFRNYWLFYIPILVAIFSYFFYYMTSLKGKLWREKFVLKIPLLSTLAIQAALTRFCRTMATLLQGGMTLVDALRIARPVMRNHVLEQEIEQVEHKILEGSSFSREIGRSKQFPPLMSRMLIVSEEAGTSGMMFHKIADLYEEELEKILDRVMALAQPVILVVMGLVIGLVLVAILIPLTDMSSFNL